MRVFTVIGASHSGKTTLTEALAGLEDTPGESLEVAGVATVRTFRFMGDDWAAIDIADGPENLSHAGPALAASDAVVLCVAAEAEAAVLSAPYLRLIEEAGIPCLLFINRIDVATDRVSEIVAALQIYSGHNIVLRQVPLRSGTEIVGAVDLISERAWQYREGQPSSLIEIPQDILSREQEARTALLESLADFDDTLLEQLIEDKSPMTADVYEIATRVLQQNELVPALLGSALHRNGIMRLMKSLRHEAPGFEAAGKRLSETDDVLAAGFLADFVKHLGKAIVIRAFGTGTGNGEPLAGSTVGNITKLDTKSTQTAFAPGKIGVAVKADHLNIGSYYTRQGSVDLPDWAQSRPGSYRRILTPLQDRDETRLSNALARFREIDPGLSVEHDEQTGQTILNVQGPLHLRRLIAELADGFGVQVEQSTVPPSLRETIANKTELRHRHRKQSGGAGQFADVVIDFRPEPRGTGFRFEQQIKGGAVPRNYIPSVEAGVCDALSKGPHGFPVVDISVVLKDGKHHAVDSSDYAFKTAGKNATREALASVGTLVLQPIIRAQIQVPSIFAGGLIPIISGMKGQVLGFESHPQAAGWDVFNALVPMVAYDELFNALASATRGTAWFTSEFDHYQELRGADHSILEAAQPVKV